MAATTGIAWCDSTFNPWIGCTRVSPGCDSCYAEALDKRHRWGGAVHWGAGVPRQRTSPANWKKPLAWNARPFYRCRECGWRGESPSNCPSCAAEIETTRRGVFCASLADVFDNEVEPAWRSDLFILISETPELDWLLLTKRIGNAKGMLPVWYEDPDAWAFGNGTAHPNVWLGASVVNQEEADRDIPKLLATPAAKRFVSYEPAIGPVNFGWWLELGRWDAVGRPLPTRGLDWIIIGGESTQGKHRARPFDIAWARSTVRQCRQAGVPVFVKQLGSAVSVRNDSMEEWPDEDAFSDAIPDDYHPAYQGEPVCIRLKDRAAADPAEWPKDLRVQEFPE